MFTDILDEQFSPFTRMQIFE